MFRRAYLTEDEGEEEEEKAWSLQIL